MLEIGELVPEWSSVDEQGKTVTSADLLGKRFVLYFYPRANTPGCTREAVDFRDSYAEFEKLGVAILGISVDSVKRQYNFKEKHSLPFSLLSDPDKEMVIPFGAERDKPSAKRITYLISPDGRVEAAWSKVKGAGHVDDLLTKLNELVKQHG
ncbi:peroxiredoxin [bacterium]|nr:peroxiredoxin [bacterium]